MVKHEDKFDEDKVFVSTDKTCLRNGVYWGTKAGIMGGLIAAFPLQKQLGVIAFPVIVGHGLTKYALPGALGGAVFASTTCLLDNMRSKDTPISNAFFGGLAAGMVVGAKSHNPWMGLQMGLTIGVSAALIRCFVCNAILRADPQRDLDHINESLYMADIAHLGPQQK